MTRRSSTVADRVEYRAEIGVLSGAEALMEFLNQYTGHMGPAALHLRQEPQVHHRRARLRWEISVGAVDGERTSFAEGTDVIRLGEDGRITSVTSFLDRAPEGFDPAAHH